LREAAGSQADWTKIAAGTTGGQVSYGKAAIPLLQEPNGEGHRIHHEDPLVLIAMAWFMIPTTVFGLWYLCSVMLRLPFFAAGLAGWLAGSVWYGVVHHSHHHWAMRIQWLRKLRTS
jgi:hypothetical protein